MNKIKDFTDLEVYQLSLEISFKIYQLTRKFPKSELFEIVDQLKRSSSSIGANIAEGFGRYHRRDFIKFLYNSRGSLNETKHFLTLSEKLGYINKKELDIFELDLRNLSVKLNNLIKSIYKSIPDN